VKPASPGFGAKFSSACIRRCKKTPDDFKSVELICQNKNPIVLCSFA